MTQLSPGLFSIFGWAIQIILTQRSQNKENKNNKLGLSSAKLSRTKFGWCEVIFEVVLKQFAVKKILWSKKFGQNFYKSEKFWFQTNWFPKNVGSKRFWVKKNLAWKVLVQRNIASQMFWIKKFWVKKNFGPEKLRPTQNWVKIGSGTTELFMKWKKVVSTNIACTNVTVTIGIKDGPRILPLKLG